MAKIGLDDYWEYYRDTSEMLGKNNAKFDCGADKRTCINKFWKEEKAKRIAAEEKARQDRAARKKAEEKAKKAEKEAHNAVEEAKELEMRVKKAEEEARQERQVAKDNLKDIKRLVDDKYYEKPKK